MKDRKLKTSGRRGDEGMVRLQILEIDRLSRTSAATTYPSRENRALQRSIRLDFHGIHFQCTNLAW